MRKVIKISVRIAQSEAGNTKTSHFLHKIVRLFGAALLPKRILGQLAMGWVEFTSTVCSELIFNRFYRFRSSVSFLLEKKPPRRPIDPDPPGGDDF